MKNEAESATATRLVEISVNGIQFDVEGPTLTGLEIKRAAIAAGASIGIDFQLSEELGGRQFKIVGDTDVVAVHKGSTFVAVAPDDNS